MYRGLGDISASESSISNPIFNYRACLQCVGDGSCGPWELGGTWWWKGGRTKEAEQKRIENQYKPVTCLGHARIT